MGDRSRVVWSEGMFLRPQHFQQAQRYQEFAQHLDVFLEIIDHIE